MALNPRQDTDELARAFARDGFVSIPDILDPDCAARLHGALRAREDWVQAINSGEKLIELDRTTRASMNVEQKSQLDTAVYAGARYHFQFRYETIRVPDEQDARLASADPLARFAHWWSTGEARELLRTVCGMPKIEFADAQATAYSPGDFLTEHSDDVAGKNRLAAYVLGLTPKWRLEWGGMLVFHPEGDDSARALVPGFNRLNLLRVPRSHSVSEVTRAAAYRRYSITGWLRH
ncbi:MAG: 2OG-Fe(II) oxygenase [Erythrobacter sp.]